MVGEVKSSLTSSSRKGIRPDGISGLTVFFDANASKRSLHIESTGMKGASSLGSTGLEDDLEDDFFLACDSLDGVSKSRCLVSILAMLETNSPEN